MNGEERERRGRPSLAHRATHKCGGSRCDEGARVLQTSAAIMLSLRFLGSAGLALVLVACGGSTTGLGQGSGGNTDALQSAEGDDEGRGGANGGGTNGGTTGNGTAPVGRLPALARTRAQNDVLWKDYWAKHPSGGGSSSGSGSTPLDPNDLFLQFSDVGVACSEVTVDLPCGGHWSASIGVPPALQKPGVYDLGGPELSRYSHMSESGAQYGADPKSCSGGGGSFGTGTLEIISIDATSVKFKVNAKSYSSFSPNGEYTAVRCP